MDVMGNFPTQMGGCFSPIPPLKSKKLKFDDAHKVQDLTGLYSQSPSAKQVQNPYSALQNTNLNKKIKM